MSEVERIAAVIGAAIAAAIGAKLEQVGANLMALHARVDQVEAATREYAAWVEMTQVGR